MEITTKINGLTRTLAVSGSAMTLTERGATKTFPLSGIASVQLMPPTWAKHGEIRIAPAGRTFGRVKVMFKKQQAVEAQSFVDALNGAIAAAV